MLTFYGISFLTDEIGERTRFSGEGSSLLFPIIEYIMRGPTCGRKSCQRLIKVETVGLPVNLFLLSLIVEYHDKINQAPGLKLFILGLR